MGNKRITAEYDMIAGQPTTNHTRELTTNAIDTIKHQIDAAAQRPVKSVDKHPSYYVWERVYALGDLGAYIAMIALFFLFTVIVYYAF